MASTAAVKKVLKAQSKLLSAQTPWSIPSTSKARKPSADTEAASAFLAGVLWAEVARWEVGVGEAVDRTRKKNVPMARKFWNEFQGRLAGRCLRFQRKNRSTKSTAAFRMSCAMNTTWDSLRRRMTTLVITSYC